MKIRKLKLAEMAFGILVLFLCISVSGASEPKAQLRTTGIGNSDVSSFNGAVSVDSYTIMVTIMGPGYGSVSPAGSTIAVQAGGSKTFMFTPFVGCEVSNVMYGPVGGAITPVGPVSSFTFTNVLEDMRLDVEFSVTSQSTSYTISVSKDGAGTVSPAGPVTVLAGGGQTFTFTPADGWEISDVSYGTAGGGTRMYVGPVSSYTFINVQNNMDLGVVFTERAYDADASFPIYEIQIPVQAGQILDFRPLLRLANPPGGFADYYFGYLSQEKLFMARQEIDGKIEFEAYDPDTGLLRCGTYDFQGGATWECDTFGRGAYQTDLVTAPHVDFFIVGVGVHGDLSTLQGALFKFLPQ